MKTLFTWLFAATLFAGCSSFGELSNDGNTLRHDDLYVQVTKPSAWRFLSPKEKFAARHAVDYVNTRWDMFVKQSEFPPRIWIAKYPEPRAQLNPSFTIDLYPIGPEILNDPVRAANWVVHDYQRYIFPGVMVIAAPQPTELAGRRAAFFHIRYTLKTKNGGDHRVDLQGWTVTRGTSAYIICATDAQEAPDNSPNEFLAMIQSVRFLDQPPLDKAVPRSRAP